MNDESSRKRSARGNYGPAGLNVTRYYNAPVATINSGWFFWQTALVLYLFGCSICTAIDVTIHGFIRPFVFIIIFTIVTGLMWVGWIACNIQACARPKMTVKTDGEEEDLKPSPRHVGDIFAAVLAALYISVIMLIAFWMWWASYGHYDVLSKHATGEHALAIFKWKLIEIAFLCLTVTGQFAGVKAIVSIAYPEGMLEK